MDKLLAELNDLLHEEISLHQGLRDELVFEAEQDGKQDSTSLLRLQQRKYHLLSRIEGVETQRIGKVRELAHDWNEPAEGLTLKRIISRAEPPRRAELQGCYDGLMALVQEIRALARTTGTNAQARLKAVEATLHVVGEAAKMHPTYSEEGRLQQRPPTFKHTSA